MKLDVNKKNNMPLYQQIVEQIRAQVLGGQLAAGYRLPPERRLAESLGVNRTTVLNAYRELKAEGLIGSHVGQGTVVLETQADCGQDRYTATDEPVWEYYFNEQTERRRDSLLGDLLNIANRPDVISFAAGVGAPGSGPFEAIRGIEAELEKDVRALLYSPAEGFMSFRKAICGYMEGRGCYCAPGEVMAVSGATQGIDLAARTLIDPGDVVVVEEATFFPALEVFHAAGARIMTVPMDGEGMRVDILEQLLTRYRPKLIYTIPTFHNPTGTLLPLERRKELLRLATAYKTLILEDDAYGELYYDEAPLPTLKSMDGGSRVIYLNTFSKTVYPGLRTGWVVAHKALIKQFAMARSTIDLHNNCVSQVIIERFIENGGLEKHLGQLCREYPARRDTMTDALRRYAPAGMEWTVPKGGFYLWCRLPEGVSGTALLKKASEYKVAYVPGPPFYQSGGGDGYMRLNFTFASPDEVQKGIKLLCSAVADMLGEREYEYPADMEINPVL